MTFNDTNLSITAFNSLSSNGLSLPMSISPFTTLYLLIN